MNFEKILFDSDILVEYFRGNAKIVSRFESDQNRFLPVKFSVISHYELLKGFKLTNSSHKLSVFKGFCLYRAEIINIDPLISEKATDIYSTLEKEGQRIGTPDCLIAATAIINNLLVCTNNEGHFQRIPELSVVNWLKE